MKVKALYGAATHDGRFLALTDRHNVDTTITSSNSKAPIFISILPKEKQKNHMEGGTEKIMQAKYSPETDTEMSITKDTKLDQYSAEIGMTHPTSEE